MTQLQWIWYQWTRCEALRLFDVHCSYPAKFKATKPKVRFRCAPLLGNMNQFASTEVRLMILIWGWNIFMAILTLYTHG